MPNTTSVRGFTITVEVDTVDGGGRSGVFDLDEHGTPDNVLAAADRWARAQFDPEPTGATDD